MNTLREHFFLDPDVTFLNHGSFGATPRPVMEAYQAWQWRMERQPVRFMRELGDWLAGARQVLGEFVNAAAGDLVFVPNATTAVNIVARSLDLGPSDQVLMSDHEYGACERTWQFLAGERGFELVRQPVDLPVTTDQAIVDQLWAGVTPRTRLIFISHITSPTAVTMPVADVCGRAREAGILTLVDGAHALGQIPLDMGAIGADFYTSNGHKWLCSPKGSAFLYATREAQAVVKPLIIGWGWGANRELSYGSDFLDYLQWTGTDDYSAYLAVPDAIRFQTDHNWDAVRADCHSLATAAATRINQLTGLPAVYASDAFYCQMALAEITPVEDVRLLQRRLYDEHRIEVPCINRNGRQFIRISIQAYNTADEVDALLAALGDLLLDYRQNGNGRMK